MNAEYLLDAIGQLDDDLVREAENYRRPKARYGRLMGWAACFAVAVALGYVLTHFGMGGGAPSYSGGGNGGAPASGNSAPSASNGGSMPQKGDSGTQGAEDSAGALLEPEAPMGGSAPSSPSGENAEAPGEAGDWLFAIRVDGTVYRATEEYIHLDPEEGDIRYTTSFINSAEPEEDGQANFEPVGRAYMVLEDGRLAVRHGEETDSWRIYDSAPPWEK